MGRYETVKDHFYFIIIINIIIIHLFFKYGCLPCTLWWEHTLLYGNTSLTSISCPAIRG